MKNNDLFAVSPVDGRYHRHTKVLSKYFSEAALIKYRVKVEVEYFIALCELPLPQLKSFDSSLFEQLRELYKNFTSEDAKYVKDIEKTTNHDVKAIEYFVKKKFDELNISEYKEFIHFGLTSQDINNTSMPMMTADAQHYVIKPLLDEVIDILKTKTKDWADIPMLARTHGQPASPTILGKEIKVFTERLENQIKLLIQLPFTGKFGGATGNFNAHYVAYPEIDWVEFANKLLGDKLHLLRQQTTTQIEHYDSLATYFDTLKRINNILIDLDRDIWAYVSMNYFKQKIIAGEVGSSAMPHKVNPIDFENSEGNLGIANALLEHLSSKLPISRLQRDLTDSTVTRNIGMPLAHMVIALKSLSKGLNKLILNESQLQKDLENNWAVVAEAIQTILRRENYPNPYEALKQLTRTNDKIDQNELGKFIDTLKVSNDIKKELKKITPWNYTGINLAK
ncbi:MAG: adenylosuccinate lyase [Bacteroidota bacterium]|nr:adenylosuccinate lyase [Bacteroidota bacterium]